MSSPEPNRPVLREEPFVGVERSGFVVHLRFECGPDLVLIHGTHESAMIAARRIAEWYVRAALVSPPIIEREARRWTS